MAGWDDIRTSDQLFDQEENVVRAIANLLQFHYICSPVTPHYVLEDTKSQQSGRSILKHVYRVLPYSLGFPAWDGEVSLVCMTSMSEGIIWDYVAEAFDIKADMISRSSNSEVVIRLSDIRGLPSIPSHISTLRLLYTQQDWTILDNSHGIKDNINTSEDSALAKAYDSQAVSRTLEVLADSTAADKTTSEEVQPSDLEGNDAETRQTFFSLFRSVYLRYRHWARCTGILGAQFKMLTDEILLHQFVQAFEKLTNAEPIRLDETLTLQAVLGSDSLLYPRKMLSPYGGRLGVKTPSGVSLDPVSSEGTRAFTAALETVDYGRMPLESWADAARKSFLNNHESFLRLDARCWIPKMRMDFAKTIPEVLVRLQSHFRNGSRRVLVSIWPFSVADPEDQQEGENVYVLGVYRFNEDHAADTEYLDTMCQQYVFKLKYDQSSASLDFRVASKSEVALLLPNCNAEQESMLSTPSIPQTAQAFAKLKIDGAKFRTASAAMNRLRWDSKHASLDYEVGYVDRFEKDLMWKSLEKWEKMTEDEEFVPEHRIQKIRSKPEGIVVWDREKRFDGT